jgi:hydroxypyruvate isomerase
MKLSCASASFPLLSFEKSLKQVALLDIGYADISAHVAGNHLQPELIEHNPSIVADRVRRAAEAAAVRISDLFPSFGRGFGDRPANTPDPQERAANRKRFAAFAEFCRQVGCPGMTILPGVIYPQLGPDGSFDSAVQGLRELVEIGGAAGLRVSIEAHLESVVEEPERALQLVQAVPGLQFTLDYTHFVAAGVAPERVHPLIQYTGHLHARQGAPGMLQATHDAGTIDYAGIVRRLAAAGYDGFLSIEYTWQEWRGCNRLDVLSESLILRDQLRSYLANQN